MSRRVNELAVWNNCWWAFRVQMRLKVMNLRRLVSQYVFFLSHMGAGLEKLELYLTRELVWRSEYNERNGTKERS